MAPAFELDVELPPAGSRKVLRELHRQIRSAILEGRLNAGVQLPPSRTLAAQLGVARNTIVAIYDLLLSEGYLQTRLGAGTFVSADFTTPPPKATLRGLPDSRLSRRWRTSHEPAPPAIDPPEFDMRLGVPDTSLLPLDAWRRLSNRTLRSLSATPAHYLPPEGLPALRQAIAGHVSFARAVACNAESVVVTAGAQQAFDLLSRILVTPGETRVVVEDPGYPPLRDAFAAAGARIAPVPVDREGVIVERIPSGAKVVCVTPSHQFPLGVPMSPSRRRALLDFAQRHRATIVEDDYDGEFRFDGRPLDALQTLDRSGSVFYVGTFSKSLFPGLRLGYVVAPSWALPALVAAKKLADWHPPALAQGTLAPFIAEGHLARHVRRMRRIYDQRRTLLVEALARHAPELEVMHAVAGLHIAALLPKPLDAADVARHAAARGVAIEDLARYAARPRRAVNGVAFGYGAIPASRVEQAARLVAAAVDAISP